MSGETVLIVDDNPANLRLACFVLERNGYVVRSAANAEKALAAVNASQPRMILMDIQLPGMDGLELTRRLKSDHRTRGITVIALTSYAMKGDEERALLAGCDGYLSKPIDTRCLAAKVAELLARGPPASAGGGK
jgi:CheY-like chemotaxis protein